MGVNDNHMYVGQIVWHPYGDYIEQGKIISMHRVRYGSGTEPIEDENGEYDEYVASFNSGIVRQTYEWRFFTMRRKAGERLAVTAQREIDAALANATKWQRIRDDALGGRATITKLRKE